MTDTKDPKTKRGIQSITTAGRILRAMAEHPRPVMLKELSATTGIPAGQLHAYMVSLKEVGLVEQEPGQGKYLLGAFSLTLGAARMRAFDPLHNASTTLHDLAHDHGLLITVSVWDFVRPVIVQVHRGAFDIHVSIQPGDGYQLLTSSSGLLFSALLPERTVEPIIAHEFEAGYRPKYLRGPKSRSEWQAAVAEIRQNGYALLPDSPFMGLKAISFPVRDISGAIKFTVSAMASAERLSDAPDNDLFKVLRDATRSMTQAIGGDR